MESDDPEELEAFKKRKYQYMAKDREGSDVFLADSNYVDVYKRQLLYWLTNLCKQQLPAEVRGGYIHLIWKFRMKHFHNRCV